MVHRNFHRHWFGHLGPALGIPLQKKSRTSSAGVDAAFSGRSRANSCCHPYPYGRNSPSGSHGSCGPGTRRPIRTHNPFSPESDDANTIAAHILCQRPLPGPPGWPHHVCTPNRHPQLPRRGGALGKLRRMGESAGRTAQYRRLVLHALPCSRWRLMVHRPFPSPGLIFKSYLEFSPLPRLLSILARYSLFLPG